MNIYIDNGAIVKEYYLVTPKVAKAIMTLLEMDDKLVWSETLPGFGVKIVDKENDE